MTRRLAKQRRQSRKISYDAQIEKISAPASSLKLAGYGRSYQYGANDESRSFAVIRFINRDSQEDEIIVPSSFLVANQARLIEMLADKHYRWEEPKRARAIIDELNSLTPSTKFTIVFVPGWHGEAYYRPGRLYSGAVPSDAQIRLKQHDSAKLGAFLLQGSLKTWKKEVALVAQHSDLARLFLSLPFAATILKIVGGKSFGVVVVGESSTGKTSLLRLGASVMGHNGPNGLPTLGASRTAIEQYVLGYRDGFIPLDEIGDIEGKPTAVDEFIKALSFGAVTGRNRERANEYERSLGTIKPDNRIIVGMTTETSLAAIARSGNRKRLRGEEVRLIELPAVFAGAQDIFNGTNADKAIGTTLDERRNAINTLERACIENQGVAHSTFLEHLVQDGTARTKLQAWIAEFMVVAEPLVDSRSVGRILMSFAIIYAAAQLAIAYRVLPWNSIKTQKALLRCVEEAVRHLSVNGGRDEGGGLESEPSDDEVISAFRQKLAIAEIRPLPQKMPTPQEQLLARSAEGFNSLSNDISSEERILLKARVLREWYSDARLRTHVLAVLKKHRILGQGRNSSTGTIQKLISAVGPKRRPYYVIRKSAD